MRQHARNRRRTRRSAGAVAATVLSAGLVLGGLAPALALPSPTPDAQPTEAAAPSPSSTAPEPADTAPTPDATPTGGEIEPQVTDFTALRFSDTDEQTAISSLAAGPDGATTSYVFWDVRDLDGVLVAGATFQLQGPRTGRFNSNWNEVVTVPDCVSTPCAGPDLDADAGEFLVKAIDDHTISSSNRYRVRQQTAPAGYYFTVAGNEWQTIPGDGNTPSGWENKTYDFGTFSVARASDRIKCQPGYVYQVSGSGWLRQVAPNGAITNLAQAGNVSSFNGIGIGNGGSPVYAYNRTNSDQTANIYTYNPATNSWTNTGDHLDTKLGNSLVAGAVSLSSGKFMFGGFTADGKQFRIWRYNPGESPRFTSVGYITTGSSASATNGDMAFDNSGNLFVVRGSGSSTTVFSITAANLAGAGGGLIPSSQSASFTTMSNVNGVAFDADGRAFLGAGSELRRYNMPDWSGASTITDDMSSSTDLASCGSPATITIKKDVRGRVNAADQFALTLAQSGTTLGQATTTGSSIGVQTAQIGPLPTVRGATLALSEAGSNGANLADYASSYACTVDDVPLSPAASGAGTSGSVTIPSSGQSVVCMFTNAPLLTEVTVHKVVQDAAGKNPAPGVGWTVGAAASGAQNGTLTSTPKAGTQQTGANGAATWTFKHGAVNTTTDITISESTTQPIPYTFVEGSCIVVTLSGEEREVTLANEAGAKLEDIAPGSTVDCTFVNKKLATNLTLVKKVSYGEVAATTWTLSASGPQGSLPGPQGVTGAPKASADVTPGVAYQLGEAGGPDTYVQQGAWACVNQAQKAVTVADGRVNIVAGDQVVCTVTNTTAKLTLLKKTADGSGLVPADFTLTGTPASGFTLAALQTAGATTASAGNTFEVRPAHTYTLAETTSDGTIAYRNLALQKLKPGTDPAVDANWEDVGSADIQLVAGEHATYRFVNDKVPAVVLPLTGGTASDAFLLLGGAIVSAVVAVTAWRAARRMKRGTA
ncbi:hypothetical protein MRBLMI12_002744 [Microbacterium sp. LMI12-1-1.1]|uniref:hypothetical protein n=1 Tax=Microbacterium sp. LMI12-1-1.1 TaxID=3135225 RepID=UPI0034127A09